MTQEKTYILGISAYYHDSAVALLCNGEILAAAHEERFTRKKHDAGFPTKALAYVLDEAGISLGQVQGIAFYDKPLLKFERLLETYHAFAPKGFTGFLVSMPLWLKEKLFMRKMLTSGLSPFLGFSEKMPQLYFPEHHLSHAASAFYPSPFEEAAIVTIDGVGEWTTTSLCHGKGNNIKVLREIHFPHSLGLMYSAFTAYCGFKVNSGEYKLMGLAPYGDINSSRTKEFIQKICDNIIDIRPDGSYVLNMDYFAYATELVMYRQDKWQVLFGLKPRVAEAEDIDQAYMDLALAIQTVTEEIVLNLAKTAKELTNCENLCMAGGVALNCVANGKLLLEKTFKNLWIQPASGDAGGALGAAYSLWYIGLEKPRKEAQINKDRDSMQGAYLGPEFGLEKILKTCKKFNAPHIHYADFNKLCEDVCDFLTQGKVVGWFQGRMEYGPRALGNRSILGDPRNPEMQKKLNLSIKYREGFRPFAPSVAEEHNSACFVMDTITPYMLLVAQVNPDLCKAVPENYQSLDLWQRLYFQRSSLPAITHVDYSARIQSVSKATNPRYWNLINTFKEKHNCPVVVNTSFNVRGEPIICTPEDAYLCFMRTEMDYLVMGDVLLCKSKQPVLQDSVDWKKEYVLD